MKKSIFIFLSILSFQIVNAQTESLEAQIENLMQDKYATVGVAAFADSRTDTCLVNGEIHFVMQSVYKFPIALAVLAEIDKGKFSLQQEIKLTKKDLLPNTWSPIRDKYQEGERLTVAEIIKYTVALSDNNGCDILLRLIGGPSIVQNFLVANGFKNISIKNTEEEMHLDSEKQFLNWSTPMAMSQLLYHSYKKTNNLLSESSYNFIWDVLFATSTGANRLRGQLPQDTKVAHKTGSSGADANGVHTATNNVGVIVLPNGRSLYISVFVLNSSEDSATNDRIIADIARLCYDHFK